MCSSDLFIPRPPSFPFGKCKFVFYVYESVSFFITFYFLIFNNFFIFYFNNFFFLSFFLAVLGLCFCARAFSSCGKQGPLFIAVCGPLTVATSLVAEHRLQTRRLSSCGSWAQLLRGMWDLPRPGLEPVSPALAGGFLTTAPPGKPENCSFSWWKLRGWSCICICMTGALTGGG